MNGETCPVTRTQQHRCKTEGPTTFLVLPPKHVKVLYTERRADQSRQPNMKETCHWEYLAGI